MSHLTPSICVDLCALVIASVSSFVCNHIPSCPRVQHVFVPFSILPSTNANILYYVLIALLYLKLNSPATTVLAAQIDRQCISWHTSSFGNCGGVSPSIFASKSGCYKSSPQISYESCTMNSYRDAYLAWLWPGYKRICIEDHLFLHSIAASTFPIRTLHERQDSKPCHNSSRSKPFCATSVHNPFQTKPTRLTMMQPIAPQCAQIYSYLPRRAHYYC